jgi:hypothetical protein
MDGAREFLENLRQHNLAQGNFRGLLHVLIGRRIARADGTVLSTGVTWRELAGLLKQMRWDRDAVREIGLDPDELPPRDRQRYWYTAISAARVDTAEARAAGDRVARAAEKHGFVISPPPGGAA